nr:hypothetical protein [Nanoarchaeum sp.]
MDKFDELVEQYNNWLYLASRPTRKFSLRTNYHHPIYSRLDLTPEQKDAIALGSSWSRVGKHLESIISENTPEVNLSVQEATAGKIMVERMYNHFKSIYNNLK